MDQLHSTQLLKSSHQIMSAQMDVAAYVARFADDVPGDLAERYSYVNRSLPDSELDAFVDALARRIASSDKGAIADTERLVDVASLPSDAELSLEWDAFLASLSRSASQLRIKALIERGFRRPGDVEDRLEYHVGQLDDRFHETGIDEASIDGTGSMLEDSSFEKS